MSEHEIKEKLHEVEFELVTVIIMLVVGLIYIATSDLVGLIFVIIIVVSGLAMSFVKLLKKAK